jgi:hypothetical protein
MLIAFGAARPAIAAPAEPGTPIYFLGIPVDFAFTSLRTNNPPRDSVQALPIDRWP